jgi:uncharacterized protein (DUF2236 family)
MSRGQLERFYLEYKGLGRLIGVRDGDLPPDWDSFRLYFDDVVANQLERTESVDRVLRSIDQVTLPRVPQVVTRVLRAPARRVLYVGGIGLLPPTLRERFDARWTRREEREFRALGAASRRMTPVLPNRLRVMGPTQLRLRRRAIARGPLGADRRQAPAPLAKAA